MNGLELLKEYSLFLAPLIILHSILAITALIHITKHPKYRFGNKVIWIIVVLFIQIIGSVVYFILGRSED